jgi:DNA-binding HxlR family transcriptional regulator
MTGYGQFCAVARAHEVLGGRWTLLVVRELLSGATRFNEIRRGIPRISRTMLSERLQELAELGVILREDGASGPEYAVTEAGAELAEHIRALGVWGQRWLPRDAATEDIDLEPLLIDMLRRVKPAALPSEPMIVRFEVRGHRPRFLLLKAPEISLCDHNLGFPERLVVRVTLAALAAWWRGDIGF